jgi:hypothetical protein
MLPDRFVATGIADEDDPIVRVSFEVVAGIPQCRRMEIIAIDGGREVRPTDVHSVHLADVLELVYSQIGLVEHDGSWTLSLGGAGVRAAVRSARKGRPRTMTPELLGEVAAIYREHVDGGTPTAEVARRFSVASRTARLYIKKARDSGLLGGSIPGRAGEIAKEGN